MIWMGYVSKIFFAKLLANLITNLLSRRKEYHLEHKLFFSYNMNYFNWRNGPMMNTERKYAGSVTLSNGTWWVLGGEGNTTIQTTTEM